MSKSYKIVFAVAVMLVMVIVWQIQIVKELRYSYREITKDVKEIQFTNCKEEYNFANLDFKQIKPQKTIQTIKSVIDTTEIIESRFEETTEKTSDSNIYIGTFKLTAYCSCHECCDEYANNRPMDENGNEIVYGAIGEILTEGYSIAVDPKVIPYRTEVLIDGNVYKAQDCGGAINGNEIDVYFSNHQSAKEFGVQYKDVYIIGNMSDGEQIRMEGK